MELRNSDEKPSPISIRKVSTEPGCWCELCEALMLVDGLGDLAVFPCGDDKRPLMKAWPTAAQRIDPQPHWPLVGVPTGDANGFSVVDVDLEGLGWFDAQHLSLTRMHRTRSGGLHLLL